MLPPTGNVAGLTAGDLWPGLIAPMFPDFLQAYPDIRLDAHFLDRRVDIVAEGLMR
ncbi:hypothetical protein LNO36_15145 [Klebsiella variicola subsp. variicola]|nr:hypothetical protein [Klebsiella variicola subsp. variicola]